MFKRFGMAFIVGLFMLIAAVGCNMTTATAERESKSLQLDVSFMTAEQQAQWKQFQEGNPGLVNYVQDQANRGASYLPTSHFVDIQKTIFGMKMSEPDRNILYAVVGYAAAGKNGFLGELFAREISNTVLRDAVLVRVVDTYASNPYNRRDALRILDDIQGKTARDAAYAILAAK